MATILACTRSEDMVRELVGLLRRAHQLAIVPHVADAVRLLLLIRVDAVVLDVDEETPERLEALPVIRRMNPQVPTLAVLGRASLEAEAAVRASGICCLLLRPLTAGELERQLVAALRWRVTARSDSPRPDDANALAAAP